MWGCADPPQAICGLHSTLHNTCRNCREACENVSALRALLHHYRHETPTKTRQHNNTLSKPCNHSCSCDPEPSRICGPLIAHRAWCGSVAGLQTSNHSHHSSAPSPINIAYTKVHYSFAEMHELLAARVIMHVTAGRLHIACTTAVACRKVLTWCSAKMLDCLTGILGPSEQACVGACGCQKCQLIKSQALATSLQTSRESHQTTTAHLYDYCVCKLRMCCSFCSKIPHNWKYSMSHKLQCCSKEKSKWL